MLGMAGCPIRLFEFGWISIIQPNPDSAAFHILHWIGYFGCPLCFGRFSSKKEWDSWIHFSSDSSALAPADHGTMTGPFPVDALLPLTRTAIQLAIRRPVGSLEDSGYITSLVSDRQ